MLVAACTPLAYANAGLETDVYAFLVSLTMFLLVRPSGTGNVSWAVVAGLCAIARPEGAFFGALFWSLALVRTATLTRSVRRTAIGGLHAALAFACVFAPVILFRLAYYHAWVPNSVLAKSGPSHRSTTSL